MRFKSHRFLIFFVSLAFIYTILAAAPDNAYQPTESILLSCGSTSDAADADGRQWRAESSLKSLELTAKDAVVATAAYQDPSLPSTVPYMTAKIFKSESTYKFTVNKTDRHWVRLHFYPATYNDFSPENSYFNVKTSGGITLLSNFSAYITTVALTQGYIIKEFSVVPAGDGVISLTFAPTSTNGSYVFVNGIEIISMPDIYSQPTAMVGFADQTIDISAAALQTMYRLNVGGQYLPPTNDSGLSRTWYDDTPYTNGAGVGVTFVASKNLKIQYSDDTAVYGAPVDIYRTGRSMGPDPKINANFNLSWVMQVDGNFTYVVRLHFCELQMNKVNQRVFDIFINNQTAQSQADVIAWSSQKGVPIYKDYAIVVNDGPGDEQLLVELHPSATAKPEFYDSILNGLEVFKMADANGNLAGPNPEPSEMLTQHLEETNPGFAQKSTGNESMIGGVAGGAAALGLVFAICFAVYQRKRRAVGDDTSGWLPLYGNSHTSSSSSTISGQSTTGSSHLSNLAAMCRHFSFAEIKKATKNFDDSLVIGVGGFGKVYKGIVDEGTKVAIKRSNPSSEQGVNEFQTEIEMLSKLRHKHLVSLIGFCEENGEMVLVYDYMSHGTLREHLYKTSNPPLTWKQRLEIAIGSARGLHYLHTGAKYTIIHRDVKTTNILVDENWVAKVSDFGLSKTGPTVNNQTHVSTMVKGSFGYLDPEYFRRQQITEKSDVYSFGVVLFEILCARPALNPSLPREQVSLADWALSCQRKGTLNDIIDPLLKGKIDPECLKKFAGTAEKCLSDHGVDRPSMGDVLWNLEFALQLQESHDSGTPVVEEMADVPLHDSSNNSGSFHSIGGTSEMSEDSDGLNSTAVFSQLINPTGR